MKSSMSFGLRELNATPRPRMESHQHHCSLLRTNASFCGSHCQKAVMGTKLQSTDHHPRAKMVLCYCMPHQLPLEHYVELAKVRVSDSHLSKAANDVTTKINVNVAIADARIRSYNCHYGLFHVHAMRRQHDGAGGFLCCPHERR